MNDPNSIDEPIYESTTDIVRHASKKRRDETYTAQQRRLRTERRINIAFVICASVGALCVLIAQIYGAWKK